MCNKWIVLSALFAVAVLGCGMSTDGDDGGSDAPTTACRHASDCGGGRVCIGGACQPIVSCTTSRMCPGLLCNVTVGICAECVTNPDCPSGARCASGVCTHTVSCSSDRECTTMDEVCDRGAFVCVECNADADCVAPLTCAADRSCAPAPCAAGACDAGTMDAAMPDSAVTDASAIDASAIDANAIDAGPADADAASNDVGPDSRNDSGVAATWEVLPTGPWPGDGGFTDYIPTGEFTIYALAGNTTPSFGRYDIRTHSWMVLTGLSATGTDGAARTLAGPAWVGNNLFVMVVTNAYRYDIANGIWSALAPVFRTDESQNAHDDAGHVYALTTDNRVAIYDVATNTVSYHALGTLTPPVLPRLAWDPVTARLFVVPDITAPNMYAFDPAIGIASNASFISGATTVSTMFCSDRMGGIYGTTNTITDMHIWRYDTATNFWTPMPDLPFPHNQNAQCVASSDGYLYVAGDQPYMARFPIR